MKKYPPEFEHKEITTSRIEFAEISARVANDILDKLRDSLPEEDIIELRMLLTIFSADIMAELFDNELEVEE